MQPPLFSTVPFYEKVRQLAQDLDASKAQDIVALDLSRENSLSEAVVIATARSVRHAQGLARHLLEAAKERKYEFLSMEGHDVGQWILLDLNDVVVHIFQQDCRELFRLEDLWPAAPILADTREQH